jgi:hypothetical protein
VEPVHGRCTYVCVFSAVWNVPCWGRLGSYKGSAGTENVVRLSSPGDPVVYTQIPDAAFSQRTQLHHMLVCHMHRPPPFEVDHRLVCISSWCLTSCLLISSSLPPQQLPICKQCPHPGPTHTTSTVYYSVCCCVTVLTVRMTQTLSRWGFACNPIASYVT